VLKLGPGQVNVTGSLTAPLVRVAQGTLSVAGAVTADTLSNTGGAVFISATGNVTARGQFFQSGGRTSLSGGTINATTVSVNQGVVGGAGIVSGDGAAPLATVLVNQEQAPASFADAGALGQDLGVFTVSSGTLVVRLSDDTDDYVEADAIRVERLGPPPAAPEAGSAGEPAPAGATLESGPTTLLDVDGHVRADALTDGVLILRHRSGLQDATLTEPALAPDTTWTDPAAHSASLGEPWRRP
jgi:hypothetical protein